VNARADDDALSWSGDDDPTLDVGSEDAPALPPGYTAVGRGSAATTGPSEVPSPSAPGADHEVSTGGAGNAALIAVGVLGGVYLLYAIGWLLGGLRLQERIVPDAMLIVSTAVAVAAPAIWFGAVMLLTRTAPRWARFAWLLAGALILVPWPFLTIGPV